MKNMKVKIVLFLVMFCTFNMLACSNQKKTNSKDAASEIYLADFEDNTQIETVTSEIQSSNYQTYNGYWSENGYSHEYIIKNGGTELFVEISEGNELKGNLYSQQGISERFAEINDIAGQIVNGECYYSFSNDGWENTGTLHFKLEQNVIRVDVQDFELNEYNTSGFGISGSYILVKSHNTSENLDSDTEAVSTDSLTQSDEHHSEAKMHEEIKKRESYRANCSFYNEVIQYMENVREVRDTSLMIEPLYMTNVKYYTEDDFKNVPPLIVYLAKNEIYARHGYIFKDHDLNNYFNAQLWYSPLYTAEDFDNNILNEYETENLKLLAALEKLVNN